ncbi:MAG: alpha/beta fold hydrolase [Actinomycetes bacterium]|jgi:proline iminopeptidase|nr:MAG: hypothetical protein DIU67_00170 [Actinomycetota bacterium]
MSQAAHAAPSPYLAIALVVVAGVASGLLTPRGPITATQAFVSLIGLLAAGVAVGTIWPSRWVLLAAPVLYAVVVEVSRAGLDGASIDRPSFGSTLEVVAFIVGRVLPGIVTLLPLVAGAAVGIHAASRLGRPDAVGLGPLGWSLTTAALVFLGLVAVMVARPASTAPIVGDGAPERSVAELVEIDVNGSRQSLMVRGRDTTNPVLLYLHGGPGGTDLGAIRRDVGLEQDFVVVAWDQRGSGRSYPSIDPTSQITVDQMVSDTVAVTEYLIDRFGVDGVYLVGQSWGSGLGALAAKARPDLYHAFVGVGQMVSWDDTDRMFWEDTLAWAERTGNTGLAERLRSDGPPPYDDIRKYGPITSAEHDWNPYPGFDPNNEMPAILFVPEYSVIERVNAFRGFFDVATVLYPQLAGLDFRLHIPVLQVPYYMVLGEHEARGRVVPAEEWLVMLEAPYKEKVVFSGAGHRANFDRPAEFAGLMRTVAGRHSGS